LFLLRCAFSLSAFSVGRTQLIIVIIEQLK
jgi:hypothetical protein